MPKNTKYPPGSDFYSAQATRPGATPTQASQYLRFALSQLAGENGHHKFEQLCFQLARRRIYSNVIPATGPVSAGGDQGADFETYRVGEVMPVGIKSPFFAHVAHEKVLFACSLQKNYSRKLNEDLRAAAHFSEKVDRLVFLSNWDIPVGRRHKLQEFASQTYGITLDVFDARALSDMLADAELFWLAQEYLSIPSDLVLAIPKSSHKWYEKAFNIEVDSADLVASDFFKLKDAVRFATHESAYRSDLPGLLNKLRVFRQHRSLDIQHRAFYEDFVASLRGLEEVHGFEAGLQLYFSSVALSDDTSEMTDASILISYSVGAIFRGLLEVNIGTIREWRRIILERIAVLLEEPSISKGRTCSLLSAQGFLSLFDWVEGPPEDLGQRTTKALNAGKAITIWRTMIKEVRYAPMFPLETFGKILSQLAGRVEETKDFSRLVAETDRLLAERFGKHKLAEQAFERAKSYQKSGRVLDAIEALHKAHVESFTEETKEDSVEFCTFLAKSYSEIGLHFAAKCYALAAAFAALKLDDDSLRGLAFRGLSEAAASDHASGASMEFFLTAMIFFLVSREFSMTGAEHTKQFEWSRIDFYSLILTRAASFFDIGLHAYLKDTVLKGFGTDEIYDESSLRLDELFKETGFQGVVEKTIEEGIMPPFSDAGPKRRVGWEQLGVRWIVEWPNDFQTAQTAESFCAALQILLVDLRTTELAILPSEVYIELSLHDGRLQIEHLPDNEKVSLVVRLPKDSSASSSAPDRSVMVQGVAASALMTVSAMSHEQFEEAYRRRLREGLSSKFSPYATYDRLFREFYSEDIFNEHYQHSRHISLSLPLAAMKTNVALSGPTGLHPEYSKRVSERLIRKRYKLLSGQLKYTLPQLLKHSSFLVAAQELRQEGWKDWHILQATGSIRLNYVISATLPRSSSFEEHKKAAKILYNRDEEESDPAPPVGSFTVSELRRALKLTKLSTLTGLGFHCWQATPNFDGVDRFLRRFNYWTDDVPHPKIFPDSPGPSAA
jgi:hypothetical protein